MRHKRFISINRVATLLGIHHQTAKEMLASLGLTRVSIGKRWLYRTYDVMSHLGSALGT